ncbi:hypothetical protein [Myxococcus llanfairpwllgwyngyllgogerychwyrndrobwllllantysiliogogogochensis]|uniref:hypothetical protein n=1 Tax=Myxococcus llanfairpwllgwyngyllgogerychwyrndrobwllllantysiliogogogochensis TaxID=2590453 RepID=UPI001FEB616C|nr:hypothetical protein [Myxococcus llanfairpwllgwyngyllgogerychwyrndrobwllllantysiliogogogochensis]
MNRLRNLVAVFVTTLLLGASASLAAAPVEAGKVYSGAEGEEVAVVPLTPRSSKKFILRVQGTGSDIDGKVLPFELKDWSTNSSEQHNYTTQWRGRGYTVLYMRNSNYELYVPGRGKEIRVSFDEKRTKALKSEEVYKQHQKQQEDGTLEKLMAFDRKGEMARHDKDYGAVLQDMNKSCGTSVAANIDWSTITDDQLKELSISGYCEPSLSVLKELCDVSNVAKQTVKEKVKQVSCRLGASLEPKFDAQRLIWTTSKDASNQETFAKKFYKTNL